MSAPVPEPAISLGCPVAHREAIASTGPLSPTGCPVSGSAAGFDPFEDPFQANPPDSLRWSREHEPVFYSPRIGYWVVTRFEDVKAIFRDNRTFSPSIRARKDYADVSGG